MSVDDRLRCERDCVRLCIDFAWTVDRCDYAAFVALFAADGVFERPGQSCRGSEAIRTFLDARPVDRVTRHIISNLRIDMTGPDTATGDCSAVMYQAPAASGAQLPLPVSAPMVVDYVDHFALTAEGWKFKHRKTSVVFTP